MTYISLSLVDHSDAIQQLSSNQTYSTDHLWLFWLVNEIKGCNYSWLEIRQDTLHLQCINHV